MHTDTVARRTTLIIALLALASCAAIPRTASTPGGYFDQETPGLRPAVFAPGVVSTPDAVELNGVFSPDFSEFFFTRMTVEDGERVFRMHRSVLGAGGTWSTPEHVQVYEKGATSLAVDMAYSPDGERLYFLGRHPHALSPEEPGADIWVTERTDDGGWSLATPVPPPVWTEHTESYPSLTPDDSLQFSSDRPGQHGSRDLWRAQRRAGGGFDEPVNMGRPVNTEHSESDSCVAPDGSYIVFTSGRPGGPGNGDLYVSFRGQTDADWTEPVLLGHGVNTEDTDYCPMVTPDGRYLFFSRRISDPKDAGWPGVVAGNVYWIDAQAIEALRR